VGDASFPLKFAFKVTNPFQTTTFRPISAHSASTVIASEKSSIIGPIGSRPRAFQRAIHEPCTLPLSPQRVAQKRDIAVCASKMQHLSKKKSVTKFLCVKTSSGKVVATSFPYPTVHRSIAGDVPIYLKLALKVTHPVKNADVESFRF